MLVRTFSRCSMLGLVGMLALTGCGDDDDTMGTDGGGGRTDGGGVDGGGGDTDGGGGDVDGGGGGGDGMFCQEMCAEDMDCQLGGSDTGFTCDDGRCTSSAPGGCESDDSCTATFSGWTEGCTADGDCTVPTAVCVEVDGEGRCANPPIAAVGCVGGMVEAMYPNISGEGDETVCANTSYECRDDVCVDPCESDTDCSAIPGRPVCDTDSGNCICADDSHCADVPGASVCVDGGCQCANDGDCTDVDNANTCYDGYCGCSETSVCMGDPAFDGTTFVCEEP